MTTVSQKFADNIVQHNGFYDGNEEDPIGDNPRVVKIIEYINAWGGKGYGLVFEGKKNKYVSSEYILTPRVYWEYKPK
jgi:hypothetical protein